MSDHLDRVSLKFAETTVDLKSANEAFQREIERIQILFRELQQEYVTQLEEKRQHNEILLRGAGIEEKELRKVKEMAKVASNKNMSVLLPKLKRTHLESNLMLSGRQDKILAILKGDKFSPELNSPQRRFFQSESKLGMGTDLAPVSSVKFIPG
mmetsp:Transcript_19146/g.29335  ORF Transcript_19146/g.29335 Transcript_19146/m.29335 type:complete len:154 (+) Transcript_19146:1395-1856(+)